VEATGIYLVEKEHFDAYKAQKAAKKTAAEEKKWKQKAQDESSSKQACLTGADTSQIMRAVSEDVNIGNNSDSDSDEGEVEALPTPPMATNAPRKPFPLQQTFPWKITRQP
jgi:hypothetical protein